MPRIINFFYIPSLNRCANFSSQTQTCLNCSGLNRNISADCNCDYGFYEDCFHNCTKCVFSCISWNSSENCFECINENRNLSEVCKCNHGLNETTTKLCCPVNCSGCYSNLTCNSCIATNRNISNECACNQTYYESPTNKSCLNCMNNCLTC